jgi:hypothetical protein
LITAWEIRLISSNFDLSQSLERPNFILVQTRQRMAALLTSLVNRAIDDVLSFPAPADSTQIRTRLRKLIADVDKFATEDREQAYRYVVRIWRATGFTEPSKLFPVADEKILQEP